MTEWAPQTENRVPEKPAFWEEEEQRNRRDFREQRKFGSGVRDDEAEGLRHPQDGFLPIFAEGEKFLENEGDILARL